MTQDERSAPHSSIIGRFVRAMRRMIFGTPRGEVTFIPPPADDPPDDDLAGSGVPRRPPNQSGSGSVALVEPGSAEDRVDP